MFIANWLVGFKSRVRSALQTQPKMRSRRRSREFSNVAAMVETLEPRKVMAGTPVTSVVTAGAGIVNGNGDLNAGRLITVNVNFAAAVNVNTTLGSPTLTLNDGGVASYIGGTGTSTLIFDYTVAAGQNTSDLTVTAFNNNNAIISNGSGTADTTNAVTNPAGVLKIDTIAPTATVVVTDTALMIGETTPVTITFSEAVTAFNNTDLTVTNGNLSAVSSVDGGITWNGVYTPSTGVTASLNNISLNVAGIQDLAGNIGVGTTLSNNFAIDTAAPTATISVLNSSLLIGDTTVVTFVFSEAVTSFSNVNLTVPNGLLSPVISLDGGITWTAIFTPTAGVNATGNVISLNLGGVLDPAGNIGLGVVTSNSFDIHTVAGTSNVHAYAVGATLILMPTDLNQGSDFDIASTLNGITVTGHNGTKINGQSSQVFANTNAIFGSFTDANQSDRIQISGVAQSVTLYMFGGASNVIMNNLTCQGSAYVAGFNGALQVSANNSTFNYLTVFGGVRGGHSLTLHNVTVHQYSSISLYGAGAHGSENVDIADSTFQGGYYLYSGDRLSATIARTSFNDMTMFGASQGGHRLSLNTVTVAHATGLYLFGSSATGSNTHIEDSTFSGSYLLYSTDRLKLNIETDLPNTIGTRFNQSANIYVAAQSEIVISPNLLSDLTTFVQGGVFLGLGPAVTLKRHPSRLVALSPLTLYSIIVL